MKDVPVLGKWSHRNLWGVSWVSVLSGVRQVHRCSPLDDAVDVELIVSFLTAALFCVCFGSVVKVVFNSSVKS
jgi:hypothetical protein